RRQVALPVRVRARLADDGVQLPEAHQPGLRSRQAQNQGSPAHASTRLRLPPSERRTRYPIAAGVPRAQEHPAHRQIYGTSADPIQRLVEGLSQITPSCLDHGLCVLLTIHRVPRISRRSCCSALKPELECSLTCSNKDRVHLLELTARPQPVATVQLFIKGRI